MNLSLGREIGAPAEKVFDEIASLDAIERVARERGVELGRTDDGAAGPAGATWDLRVELRGKPRRGQARVLEYRPGRRVVLDAGIDDLAARVQLDLSPLGPSRTRLDGTLDLRAASLGGRMLLQSLKLARGSLERRLGERLAALAGRLERAA